MKQNDASAPGFHSSSPSQVSLYRIIDRKLTVPTLRLVTRVLGLPHDGSQRLGSSPINAGLRPLAAGFAEQRRPSYPPSAGGEHRSAHSAGAQNAAKPSGFQAKVDLHLLHAVVENAHAATVPSHPHLPADILRRRFVKGSLHLHKTVAAHIAPGLLIARKERGWQRLQMGAFLFKACGDLFAGPAVGDGKDSSQKPRSHGKTRVNLRHCRW